MRCPLWLKLMGFTFGIVLLLGGSIFVVSRAVGQQEMLASFERESRQITSVIASDMANDLYLLDVRALRHHLEHARSLPDVRDAYVVDAQGLVLADGTQENAWRDQHLSDPFSQEVLRATGWISRRDQRHLKIGGPVFSRDGSLLGYLQITFALDDVYRIVHETTRMGLYLTLACLAVGALVAGLFAARLHRPIATIARAAREIGTGKLETRLSIRRGDELGILATAINQMATNLSVTTVSKQFVDNIIQYMADMLIVLDTDLIIKTVNNTTVHTLGYDKDTLIGMPFHQICQEDDPTESTETGVRMPFEHDNRVEKIYIARDGRHIPVSFAHSFMYDDKGTMQGIVCIAQNMTQRKQAEMERRKMVYELHDGVAQLMVSAQHHLDTFEVLWQGDKAQAQSQLELGQDRLQRAIVEARRLMAQLHPTALETQGLIPAVRRYLEDLGKEANWEVVFNEDIEELILPPDQEVAVFRIIQEALTNAWKHAHTLKIQVEMKTERRPGHTLSLIITDWGRGFQPDRISSSPEQFGLLGIRERAQMLKGTCDIESHPGQGTTVRVRIPLT